MNATQVKARNEKFNENLIKSAKKNIKAIEAAEKRLEKIKALIEPIVIAQGEASPTKSGGTTWTLRANLDRAEVTIAPYTKNNTAVFEKENKLLIDTYKETKAKYNYVVNQTTIKFK